jgi:hypothetical protein
MNLYSLVYISKENANFMFLGKKVNRESKSITFFTTLKV